MIRVAMLPSVVNDPVPFSFSITCQLDMSAKFSSNSTWAESILMQMESASISINLMVVAFYRDYYEYHILSAAKSVIQLCLRDEWKDFSVGYFELICW